MTSTLRQQHGTPSRRRRGAPPTQNRNLMLLWAGQFVNTAGLMMLVPIMPFYLQGMGTSGTVATQTWAGVAIAAPALMLTVATPLWGKLGDRIGRKWMVVRALLGLAVAMVVMATATTPLMLVAGRLLQGALGGVVEAAAAFAGSVGSSKKRGSSLGKSFSATAAGALAGPIAGGLLVGAGGLSRLMFIIAVAAVVLAVGCAAGLHEPPHQPAGDDAAAPKQARRRPSVWRVPGAALMAVAAIGAYFGVYGLIPLFAEHISTLVPEPGTASLWTGVLYSVMWGATLVGSFWWGKHNDRSDRPLRTFTLAAGGCAASIAAIALPLGPLAFIPLRLVQGFAFAALAQSLFLHFSNHAPQENKSSYVGTANSFLLIGQSAGPLLAGPLIGLMPVSATIIVMAGSCALACLIAGVATRVEKHTTDDDHEPEEPRSDPPSDEDEEEETTRLPVVSSGSEPDHVEIRPFRGWHLASAGLSELGARRSTPWDHDGDHRQSSEHEAAHVMTAWQRSGTLVRDPWPAFYAYQQTGPRGSQCGLLSAVHLDSTLLPHEDVLPNRVDGIARVSRAGAMNLDPLLLGYSGDGRTTAHLREVTQHQALSAVSTGEGQTHRIWRLPNSAHADITDELSSVAAFIADGHHRHTAARHLRRQIYADGQGPGPWDLISGLLVDVAHHTMPLHPVHRVLPTIEPHSAVTAAAKRFRVVPLGGHLDHWLRTLKDAAHDAPAFVLVSPQDAWLLTTPDRRWLTHTLQHHPVPIRDLQVTVLHTALIEATWGLVRSSPQIHYPSSAAAAVRQVREQGGIAVLLTPPRRNDLANAAVAGLRLPHKATSFGPKPHPGLVFRTFDPE